MRRIRRARSARCLRQRSGGRARSFHCTRAERLDDDPRANVHPGGAPARKRAHHGLERGGGAAGGGDDDLEVLAEVPLEALVDGEDELSRAVRCDFTVEAHDEAVVAGVDG